MHLPYSHYITASPPPCKRSLSSHRFLKVPTAGIEASKFEIRRSAFVVLQPKPAPCLERIRVNPNQPHVQFLIRLDRFSAVEGKPQRLLDRLISVRRGHELHFLAILR